MHDLPSVRQAPWSQMLTVIITRNDRSNGRSQWIRAQQELDSLVRRFGFDIVLQAAGSSPAEQLGCYQVTGRRTESLGDDAHFNAIRREVADVVYVHSLSAGTVGFGSIEQLP
jgi:hypothetical protein